MPHARARPLALAAETPVWRETARQERNRRIFQEEIDPFLPEDVLDFHVHVFEPGALPSGETFDCAGHPIAGYTLEDLERDLGEVYPGRRTSALVFGFPDPRCNREAMNAYAAERSGGGRVFALRLLDPSEGPPEAVREEILERGFVGLKPYPDYAGKADPREVEVRDMLPEWAMEVADDLALVVMLHLPRPGRLADPVNRAQVRELCERHARANVVLAHVGRSYFLKCAREGLAGLADLPNLYYDTAMVSNHDVLEHLFATVPHEKILFGTDTPVALAPGKAVEINDQYTYLTPVPWKLSISDDHGRLAFTSFLYEGLRAIRTAAERLALADEFARGLFHDNGMRLIEAALERKAGSA